MTNVIEENRLNDWDESYDDSLRRYRSKLPSRLPMECSIDFLLASQMMSTTKIQWRPFVIQSKCRKLLCRRTISQIRSPLSTDDRLFLYIRWTKVISLNRSNKQIISLKRDVFFQSNSPSSQLNIISLPSDLLFKDEETFFHRDKAWRAREFTCRVRKIRRDAFHFLLNWRYDRRDVRYWAAMDTIVKNAFRQSSDFQQYCFQFLTLRPSLRSSIFLRCSSRVFLIYVKSSDLLKRYKL